MDNFAALDNCNVVWDTPSEDSSGSMPLGNGDIGLNAWVEPNGDLLFYISKTDAWNENVRLLKLGRVRVSFDPNPFGNDNTFRQSLKLREGEIEIIGGTSAEPVTLRLWIDANAPVIHLEAQSTNPIQMRASLEVWRTQIRELQGSEEASAYGLHSGPQPIVEHPDTILDVDSEKGARVAWFHRNPTSSWPATQELQGMGEWNEQAPDPILYRTFGAVMQGDGLANESDTVLESVEANTEWRLDIYPLTQQSSVEEWLAVVKNNIARIESTDIETARAAHRDWWHAFWERSWIFVSGDSEAENVTRGYALQRFISACAGRGSFPIKFNGSLFTVDAREEGETYDADYRRWGGPYWFQNTRLAYWPMLAAGDFEMIRPLFDMYHAALPFAQLRTQKYFGHGGAFFPETMYFWGAYANTNYGWDREGKHISHVDNTYIKWYWSGALELVVLALEYYTHTGDEAYLQEKLLPLANAIFQFYDGHYPREENGKLRIYPAQSLEMWQDALNPLPEIAGLYSMLDALLALPAHLTTEKQADDWTRLRADLPPVPKREKDGQTLIAAAQWHVDKEMNVENPELYAIFPYRLFCVGKPELEMGRATYEARSIRREGGWHQEPVMAALVGLTDEAKRQVVDRFATKHEGSRFPAFWGPNYDWIPDQDHGGVALIALQFMLLQSRDEKILLAPAWPANWNVDFKLHTAHSTVVRGSYQAGEWQFETDPPERQQDVQLCLRG